MPRPNRRMFRFARSEPTENVFGDLFDVRLAARENSGPVRRRRSKDDAIIGIYTHRGRAPAREIFGILSPFRAKPSDSKDNKIFRRTVVMARDGKTAFVRAVGN